MTEAALSYQTGTVRSGDVDVFYRYAGSGQQTPVIILGPANYFDSADWLPVIELLAVDRPVAAIDPRGLGKSTWSPSKDYSHEANTADPVSVLDALGWEQAVFVGVARGGAHSILAAAYYPGRVAGLVLADYVPAIGIGHPGVPLLMKQVQGIPPKVFPTVADALGATARVKAAPGTPGFARFESLLKKVDDGYVLAARDPDFINPIPFTPSDWPFQVPIDVDIWAELAKVTVPVLNVRVEHAPAPYPAASVERIAQDFPQVEVVEGIPSGQDIAGAAPQEFADAIRTFLDKRGL